MALMVMENIQKKTWSAPTVSSQQVGVPMNLLVCTPPAGPCECTALGVNSCVSGTQECEAGGGTPGSGCF